MRLGPAWLVQKVSLEQLSRFCGNLATCLSAGLNMPTSLRACHRSSPCRLLQEIMQDAGERVATGLELSDALEPWRNRFPVFFLPVLRCGEQSGRLDEALGYLERHCQLLVEPARIMRNTWLVPLSIMLVGSAICVVAHMVFAPLWVALNYVIRTGTFYAVVAGAVIAAVYVPPFRAAMDRLKLAIPLVGPAVRELAMNRFFHAMNLLYSTGGRRVEQMIRLAADSSDNVLLRADFLRAARAIESGATIGEAFSAMATLPFEYKTTIVAGDEAGKLDAAFATVCGVTADSVHRHLVAFQQVFFRAVAAAVILSVVMTLFSLMAMRA